MSTTTITNYCRDKLTTCAAGCENTDVLPGHTRNVPGKVSVLVYGGHGVYLDKPTPRHLIIEKYKNEIFVCDQAFENAKKLDGTSSTDIGIALPVEIHNMLPDTLHINHKHGSLLLPAGKKTWTFGPDLTIQIITETIFCTDEDISERAHLNTRTRTLSFW